MTVNKPGDSFEKEADATADKVMRKPAKCPACKEKEKEEVQRKEQLPITEHVQRKCSHCEEEEKKVQRKSENIQRKCSDCEKEEKKVQRKSDDTGNVTVNNKLATDIDSHRGQGNPLPKDTKSFMEDRFGPALIMYVFITAVMLPA